ncbi:hypothetical protein M7I_1453 [Glarea lozoyensis 74030]|uniref:Uncharacterized protein n=1 Tax=Glarea lozoyensis (strain ATCC 74030 / MF5533) TaxID=1104152 RepID=H0EG45_GLAL7|nr:hypothetical protein M7I_1453 [Glarea lozoyensis 74030]
MRLCVGKNIMHTLPEKSDYHPKRNAARQRLATLRTQRFRDLVNDMSFQRRFASITSKLGGKIINSGLCMEIKNVVLDLKNDP